ncbi:MAG: RagB/SusD family nutrient uptake outer membrane protein [Solitalea sp.]
MKIFNYIGAVLALVLMGSCQKYLDIVPDNVATLDHAFSNEFNTERYLLTCYSYLPNEGGINQNPALNAGDEIWYPDQLRNDNGPVVAQGFQSVTSPRFDYWRGFNGAQNLYQGIRACNIFLENVDGVLGLSQNLKTLWAAEAKFLKAYYHFYLLRMYGPIVVMDESVPVTADFDEIRQERNTLDEGFAYVVRLLDEAMETLPETLQFANRDMGRVTKPIAAAVKARVLIEYASPLFNGNPVYQGLVNAAGEPLFPTAYDPGKWEMAAEACKEAIEICHAAGISLYRKSDYTSPFQQNDTTLLKAALRSRVTERWNQELIWGHTANSDNTQSQSMPRLYNYITNPVSSNHAPPIHIAEMYYSENGVPIEEDRDYPYENRFFLKTAEQSDRFHVEPGQQTAVLNFNRETRFYADLAFDRGVWFGNGKELDTDPWYIHSRRGEFASIFEITQYSVTGYWPKKLVNLKSEVRGGNQFIPYRYAFPILRLADLYLYYAEALNETRETPDAEVYEYVDLVRERAGLKGVVESWAAHSRNPDKPATREGMREIIQRERLIEMAFEGKRFWDIRRWKQGIAYFNKPIRGWNVLETAAEDYYSVRTLFTMSFSERDYLWPIPENELVNNPSLVQNPGW